MIKKKNYNHKKDSTKSVKSYCRDITITLFNHALNKGEFSIHLKRVGVVFTASFRKKIR